MLQVHPLLFAGLLEALGLCVVALAAWPALAWRRRRRTRAEARALVQAVSEAAPARRDRTLLCLEAHGLDGSRGEAQAKTLERNEKAFFKAVLDLGLAREPGALAGFEARVAALLDPYLELRPAASDGAATGEAEASGDDERLAALEADRARLEEELEITRNTLNSILNEYAQMFTRGEAVGTASHVLAADPDRPEASAGRRDDDLEIDPGSAQAPAGRASAGS